MKSAQTYNDNELLAGLRAGDVSAFNQLYAQYSRPLYSKMFQLVKSEKVAEELLQDLFVRLWENKQRIHIQSSLHGYLYRVGVNLVYDFFRKANLDKKIKEQFLSHFQDTLQIHPQDFDFRDDRDPEQVVTELLDTLPPQRKKVFKLCKIEGKSYQEASSLLGISVATINDHIVKAKRHLKMQISNHQTLNGLLFIYLLCQY